MRTWLFVLVLVAGCQQPPDGNKNNGPTQVDPPEPTTHVAQVRFAQTTDAANAGDFKESFTLLGQRDIAVVIDIDTSADEPTSGVHFMRFDVLNPSGAVMQTQWHAFSYEAMAPTEIINPLFQETLDVQKLASDEGWVNLRVSVPVAGTDFTRHGLLGRFTGAVYLGLESAAPSVSGTFVMEQ